MRKVGFLRGVILLTSLSAAAQSAPKGEVFGGYSYMRSGVNFHGWNGSVTGNVNDWFGIVGDVSGHYYSVDVANGLDIPGFSALSGTSASTSIHTYTPGRIHRVVADVRTHVHNSGAGLHRLQQPLYAKVSRYYGKPYEQRSGDVKSCAGQIDRGPGAGLSYPGDGAQNAGFGSRDRAVIHKSGTAAAR